MKRDAQGRRLVRRRSCTSDCPRESRDARRAYDPDVRDPEGDTAEQSPETLRVGPSRPPLFHEVPPIWRQRVVALLAFVLGGVAAGGGAVLWWQARPAPSPPLRFDEHAVELILFEAVPSRTPPSGSESANNPLQVDSALLLSGLLTSTVLSIDSPDSLDVRAPALPVTVSPDGRFRSISLKIMVRDCKAAARWTPSDRPFTISWRDEYGKVHLDRAGDFDRSMARSLIRYIEAVCDKPLDR